MWPGGDEWEAGLGCHCRWHAGGGREGAGQGCLTWKREFGEETIYLPIQAVTPALPLF